MVASVKRQLITGGQMLKFARFIATCALFLSPSFWPTAIAEPVQIQTEQRIIRRIEYRGLTSVSETDLLQYLTERDALVSVQTRVDATQIRKTEVAIQELIAKSHKSATVRSSLVTLPETNGVLLVFLVDEGPAAP
jgi:outer membrane protein assembly factor BamA